LALLLFASMAMAEAELPETNESTIIATFEAKSDDLGADPQEPGAPEDGEDPDEGGLDDADAGEEDVDIDEQDGDEGVGDLDGDADVDDEGDDESAGDGDSGAPIQSVKLQRIRDSIMAMGDNFYLKATLTGFDGISYTVQWQYDAGDEMGWISIEDDEDLMYTLIDALTLSIVSDSTNINYDWRILITPIAEATDVGIEDGIE